MLGVTCCVSLEIIYALSKGIMDMTPKKRAKVLALHSLIKKPIKRTSQNLKITKSSIGRIAERCDDNGNTDVLRQGKYGRKRQTNKKDDTLILRNSINDPKKSSRDLARDLEESDVSISDSSVRQRLL